MQDLQSSFYNRETIFQVTFSDLKVSGSEKIIWISAVRIIQTRKTSVRQFFLSNMIWLLWKMKQGNMKIFIDNVEFAGN